MNQRDHRKLLVVDGRIAILGGINISSVYSGGSSSVGGSGSSGGKADDDERLPWRDTDLQIEGPVVARVAEALHRDVGRAEGADARPAQLLPAARPQGREVVRAIGSTPDEPFSQIYVTLISAIEQRRHRDPLTNAYFVPDPQLVDALIRAAARGVDVKLILPSVSDSSLVFHAGRSHYDDAAARRGEDLRAARGPAARQDRGDRRCLGRPSARPTWTGAASYTTRS